MSQKLFAGLFLLIFFNLVFSNLVWAQINPEIGPPENKKEASDMADRALKVLPQGLKDAWSSALSFWQALFLKIKSLFGGTEAFFQGISQKAKNLFGGKVETSQEGVKKEFEKEKIEMEKDIEKK